MRSLLSCLHQGLVNSCPILWLLRMSRLYVEETYMASGRIPSCLEGALNSSVYRVFKRCSVCYVASEVRWFWQTFCPSLAETKMKFTLCLRGFLGVTSRGFSFFFFFVSLYFSAVSWCLHFLFVFVIWENSSLLGLKVKTSPYLTLGNCGNCFFPQKSWE